MGDHPAIPLVRYTLEENLSFAAVDFCGNAPLTGRNSALTILPMAAPWVGEKPCEFLPWCWRRRFAPAVPLHRLMRPVPTARFISEIGAAERTPTIRQGRFPIVQLERSTRVCVNVIVGQNVTGSWLLGFAHPAFGLTTGETFPIDVTFDGQAQFHLFGTAVGADFVIAILPNNALIDQFRKSRLMVAVGKGTTLQFNLTSTGQLLPIIANCVVKTKSGGIANAGDFSIPTPKPAAKPLVQTAASASAPPSKSPKTVDVNGTGFVISTNGHVVTNHHVIGRCVGDIRGNLTGQSQMTLRIVSIDETNDLALLQAPTPFNEIASIRGTAIHPGDAVIAIGYPFHGLLTSDFTVTAGIVSSLSGIFNNTRYLQISAAVQPGNSGGPLLDTSGNVVGLVAEKLNALKFAKATGDIPENINFAIKTGAVRDFLDNSAVSYQTAESKAEIKTADIARQARAYTLLISCTAKEKD
jgi:S1-C subfamily serine protease